MGFGKQSNIEVTARILHIMHIHIQFYLIILLLDNLKMTIIYTMYLPYNVRRNFNNIYLCDKWWNTAHH